MNKSSILFIFIFFIFSCSSKTTESNENRPSSIKKQEVFHPSFSSDSAFFYVQQQCDFGPRVPNTHAHEQCADYLTSKLKSFGWSVITQKFSSKAYDGTILNGSNIIGQWHPEIERRIVLFAHWDSRHVCDNDTKENWNKPVMGANDGASGVAVLLEVARQLQLNMDSVGIDIVFLDLEDYGQPSFVSGDLKDTWCLGTQYLVNNPYYKARPQKGILLDMVGASSPYFGFDQISLQFAEPILQEVWSSAHRLGYNSFFVSQISGSVLDDHYYLNTIAHIPTIDIIDFNHSRGFPTTWHTVNDVPDNIDKSTLKMVGEVLLSYVRK